MKKLIITLLLASTLTITAQENPNNGFLPSRVTTIVRDAFTNPAKGLIIFNTTTNGLQINTGTGIAPAWSALATGAAATSKWSNVPASTRIDLTNLSDGTTARTAGTEFIIKDNGAVGIGTTTPGSILHLSSASTPYLRITNTANNVETAFQSDASTGLIGTITSHPFRFVIGNVEKATFDVNGNLGIGTSSPSQLLHVSKNQTTPTSIAVSNVGTPSATTIMQFLLTENGTSDHGYFRRYRDGSGLNEIGFSTQLAFKGETAATPVERMRITSSGNVGIGTTAPTAQLDVNRSAGTGLAIIARATGAYNSEGNNNIKMLNLGGDLSLQMGTDGATGVGYIQAMQPGVSWSSRALVLQGNGGNVGIGTVSPTEKFHVTSAASLPQAFFNGGNEYNAAPHVNDGQITIGGPVGHAGTGYSMKMYYDYPTSKSFFDAGYGGSLTFRSRGASGSITDAMHITSSGNVGIGTLTPTLKFQVTGNVPGTFLGYFDNTSTTGYGMYAQSGSYGVYGKSTGTTAGGVIGYNFDNSLYAILGYATYAVYSSGSTWTTGGAWTGSDRRLKTNINGINDGLNTIMKLNPVSYDKRMDLKSNVYDSHENGFIAQEVQKIIPFAVREAKGPNDTESTLAVNYTDIIPVLTKAIQEQQVQIEELKAEILKLKNK